MFPNLISHTPDFEHVQAHGVVFVHPGEVNNLARLFGFFVVEGNVGVEDLDSLLLKAHVEVFEKVKAFLGFGEQVQNVVVGDIPLLPALLEERLELRAEWALGPLISHAILWFV